MNAKCRLLAICHAPTQYASEGQTFVVQARLTVADKEDLAAQVFASHAAVSGHHRFLRFCNLGIKKQESIEEGNVFSLIVYISIQDDKHGASMKDEEQ